MADYTKYTKQEMQAYAIAKNIKENQIVIVGTGLPLIGASLAKRVVCPSCHPIVESGLMDCSPVEVPRSVGDNRFMAHCAVQWPNIRFIGFEANEWLHDADRLIAFIGGAQIDPYGNVNSTCIYGKGDYVKPHTRSAASWRRSTTSPPAAGWTAPAAVRRSACPATAVPRWSSPTWAS